MAHYNNPHTHSHAAHGVDTVKNIDLNKFPQSIAWCYKDTKEERYFKLESQYIPHLMSITSKPSNTYEVEERYGLNGIKCSIYKFTHSFPYDKVYLPLMQNAAVQDIHKQVQRLDDNFREMYLLSAINLIPFRHIPKVKEGVLILLLSGATAFKKYARYMESSGSSSMANLLKNFYYNVAFLLFVADDKSTHTLVDSIADLYDVKTKLNKIRDWHDLIMSNPKKYFPYDVKPLFVMLNLQLTKDTKLNLLRLGPLAMNNYLIYRLFRLIDLPFDKWTYDDKFLYLMWLMATSPDADRPKTGNRKGNWYLYSIFNPDISEFDNSAEKFLNRGNFNTKQFKSDIVNAAHLRYPTISLFDNTPENVYKDLKRFVDNDLNLIYKSTKSERIKRLIEYIKQDDSLSVIDYLYISKWIELHNEAKNTSLPANKQIDISTLYNKYTDLLDFYFYMKNNTKLLDQIILESFNVNKLV